MKPVLRATTPEDEDRLIAFLARAFSLPRSAGFLQPDLMRWKYWTPRPDYTEPRSFVLERDGQIVAHAGLWPIVLGGARGAHMIDWASDPGAPGSGISLVQRIKEMFDFLYSIGGSEMTQKVLPAFGFKEVASSWTGARPLAPLRQAMAHQYRNWKLPARAARNFLWSLSPALTIGPEWTARETRAQEAGPRPAAFFEYLKSCPACDVHVFEIQKANVTQGLFAFSVVDRQARILGVWWKESQHDWLAAYRLAEKEVRRAGTALEVMAVGSSEDSKRAAIQSGLRIVASQKIFLLRKRGDQPPGNFEYQAADNDVAFLGEGRSAFLT